MAAAITVFIQICVLHDVLDGGFIYSENPHDSVLSLCIFNKALLTVALTVDSEKMTEHARREKRR